MRSIAFLLVAVATVTGLLASTFSASAGAGEDAAPIYGIKIPPGYRDWKLVSVAHEAGNLNDFRAVLGNDLAVEAYRAGKLPFRITRVCLAFAICPETVRSIRDRAQPRLQERCYSRDFRWVKTLITYSPRAILFLQWIPSHRS
jgi:hypothetical protein